MRFTHLRSTLEKDCVARKSWERRSTRTIVSRENFQLKHQSMNCDWCTMLLVLTITITRCFYFKFSSDSSAKVLHTFHIVPVALPRFFKLSPTATEDQAALSKGSSLPWALPKLVDNFWRIIISDRWNFQWTIKKYDCLQLELYTCISYGKCAIISHLLNRIAK